MQTRLLGMLLLMGLSAHGQSAEATIVHDSIYSSVLQEERAVEIIYPENYKPASPLKYDVLFCLEGIADFVKLEYNFLHGEGFLPDLIIVGLPNTVKNGVGMRDRDFTPTHTDGVTGGAGKFLSFLKDELVPYIEAKYPAKASGHTLYGGSLSGLFAVYAFLNCPSLFTSYIAVDPSLWWDDFYVNKKAPKILDSLGHLNNSLWIAGRNGSPMRFMGTAEMDSILKAKAPAGLDWKCGKYQDETHYSTQFKGFWDGLKFSYSGFYASTGGYPTSRKIAIKPVRGFVLKNKPFPLICYNLVTGPYIHYTVDGTEPTAASPALAGEETYISVPGTTILRAKSIGVRPEYNREDTAHFATGEAFPAMAKPEGAQPGGLRYVLNEGATQKSGRAGKGFDLGNLPRDTGFTLELNGYIKIDSPGYYILEIGGTGFKCWLNNRLIVGEHNDGNGEGYMMPLQQSFYPLKIIYVHAKNTDTPEPLYIRPQETEDFPVPPEMLYSR